MKIGIVWFKTDLRLHDNETLRMAIDENDLIIPFYCLEEKQFGITKYGTEKTGAFRTQFLLESLLNLNENLKKLGSTLLVAKGNVAEEIGKIVDEYKVVNVYAKKEITSEELTTQKEVEAVLKSKNCTLKTFYTNTLYEKIDLPFSIAQLPDIFTNFRKEVEKKASVKAPFDSPKIIISAIMPEFKGGETEALKRLHHYFDETKAISKYKETRNGLVGADYSSKFSVWLANGCISAREIHHLLKEYEDNYGENESTYWLVFELLWRDYFYFVFEKYGDLFFKKGGIKGENDIKKKHFPKDFNRWINGETVVDFIDANMKELQLTGFMSNRGRQNVASYFVHDLKLDWRYGAAYFEQQLIDYDVHSNWGNWAYLAGVGNDPRENRYFNIEKQASMYDADRKYRKLWLQKI
jgi:deoxyribodipyrimidine photo-lyase